MSNSSLVSYTKLSPNYNPRNHAIDKITIHHMAGNMSVERLGELWANTGREASSNYGIGSDGRVGMYVEEKNRSWCSSSGPNDHRAVTIEVANDGGEPDWHVSDKALATLVDLCTDICRRNGIYRLNFTGDASGNLTQHNYFTATACPGPYLKSKFQWIADEVNRRLDTEYPRPQPTPGGTYTVQPGDSWWRIAEQQLGSGSRMGELLTANGATTATVIHPGQIIKLPGGESTPRNYTVRPGDSWWKIADEQLGSGARMNELAAINGMTVNSTIHPGQVIKLPN